MLNIKIYQINMDRDKDNVCFIGDSAFLKRLQGTDQPNSSIYDKVFSGEVDAQSLEGIYRIFNTEHPKGYQGRSLSVSDVVEVISDNESSFYFCAPFGFRRVEFEPDKTQLFNLEAVIGKHAAASKAEAPKNVSLWARLGVSITATPEELAILSAGGKEAKALLLTLVRSDRCVLDGETYFPGMANEKYFSEDLEFNIGPYSLHPEKEKTPALDDKSVKKSSFTEELADLCETPFDGVTPAEPEAKVFMKAGSVKLPLYDGTHEECLGYCESLNWEFKDENDFVWDLELEDLRELGKDTPAEEQPFAPLNLFSDLEEAMLIEYKGITFDEWTVDKENNSVWAEMCGDCAEKYKDILADELSSGGIGSCSVEGCNIVGIDSDKPHYYVDFKPELIKVVQKQLDLEALPSRDLSQDKLHKALVDKIRDAQQRTSMPQPAPEGKGKDNDISRD